MYRERAGPFRSVSLRRSVIYTEGVHVSSPGVNVTPVATAEISTLFSTSLADAVLVALAAKWLPLNATRVGSGVRIPVGRTFEIVFTRIKNRRSQLRRAPSSVGRRNSMPVDEGRNNWSLPAINTNTRAVVGRGERRACLVAPDMSYV